MEKILPILMVIMSFSASIIYFYKGDVRHGIYWIGSGILISAVTF